MDILKLNSRDKEAVKELQIDLSRLGYLLKADGIFGPKTNLAVKTFQKNNSLLVDGEVGDITEDAISAKINALNKTPIVKITPIVPDDHADALAPWMTLLQRNIGLHEVSGAGANPLIIEMFQFTTLKNTKIALSDETAWCAACANWALQKTGFQGTNSAAAASFDKYGNALLVPKYGCVITLKHPNGGRHVTFFVDYDAKGNLKCLGGNQSNSIRLATYDKSQLVAARWPIK